VVVHYGSYRVPELNMLPGEVLKGQVPKELVDLVAPHLQSFDYFIGDGLEEVVQGLDPIEVVTLVNTPFHERCCVKGYNCCARTQASGCCAPLCWCCGVLEAAPEIDSGFESWLGLCSCI
jgi:hypothetical protein